MTDTSGMDRAALDRLDRLGGSGFASRIIGIFLTEVPRRLDVADEALAARDTDALANAVHSLISSAGNVGAPALADLARAIEGEAEAARWDILPSRLQALRAAAVEVCRVLDQERERRA